MMVNGVRCVTTTGACQKQLLSAGCWGTPDTEDPFVAPDSAVTEMRKYFWIMFDVTVPKVIYLTVLRIR